jgi:hypothetical protein
MKRKTVAALILVALVVVSGHFFLRGAAKQEGFRPVDEMKEGTPWTHTEFLDNPDNFQFAIVSDRAGGRREGVFSRAVEKVNLLQPEFVLSVGDLIRGYTDDEALLREERDEFEDRVSRLEMPFFYVLGNHDISNPVMAGVWEKRYGRRYYSFIYKDVLFLCLDSVDLPDHRFGIGEKQAAWARGVIGEHQDVRWTFVFMHAPLWLSEEWATPENKGATRFGQVEEALKGRPYTVFAGHHHTYTKYVRHNQHYFALATTGGGSRLGGASTGQFDHITWVTMAKDGPRISHLLLDGILDENVLTEETKKMQRALAEVLTLPGIELPENKETIDVEHTFVNPLDAAIEMQYTWNTIDTHWTIRPAEGVLEFGPKGEAQFNMTASFDRSNTAPLPVMEFDVLKEGKKILQAGNRLQPLIRRKASVTRIDAAGVINGVVSAGEYGDAEFNGEFIDYRGLGVPEHQTRFLLAYNEKALYVAVVSDEDEPEAISVQPRDRDGELWRDDSVELFIDATFDRKTYHQFAANTRDDQLDAIGGPDHGNWGDLKWNAEWQVKTKIGKTSYVTEFAIPFASLDVPAPKPGTTWGLNICRSRQPGGKRSDVTEMGAWSIPYANFHQPTHFGIVTFK